MSAWQALAGQRLFFTGGTGFVGKWMLAGLLDADRRLGLDCEITVLSRNPQAFLRDWPALRDRVEVLTGDVQDLALPCSTFDIVIHAATDVALYSSPRQTFSTCVEGTRRILTLAEASGARKMLLVSSGAVYGALPLGMTKVPETYLGGPDPMLASSAYAEGKRVSEWLACRAADEGLHVGIARVFALVGPHLPLDCHFAIGNFVKAVLEGENIVIEGDGTPYRSYLYAADMAAWLWAVLLRGRSATAYNIGSEQGLSIAQLASRVRDLLAPTTTVHVCKQPERGAPVQYYVPDSTRARQELQLPPPLGLDEAIVRTAQWYSQRLSAKTARASE
jgi:dTDP-glucose 4,6-dehydratase